MKKAYDLKKLKVKRRGALPSIQDESASNKVRITISLDKDVVDFFKVKAKQPSALPYQTQINQALQELMKNWPDTNHNNMDEFKAELLSDPAFLSKLARQMTKHQR